LKEESKLSGSEVIQRALLAPAIEASCNVQEVEIIISSQENNMCIEAMTKVEGAGVEKEQFELHLSFIP
jgi:hypothetical protein